MFPLYFGTSTRALYGAYEPPQGGDARRGIVVCNAVGREYYHAHRVLRSLALRASARGAHVLRFDYLGVGDSALEVEEVGTEDWIDSVGEAVTELKDMTGLRDVCLVGVRAGATLAMAVAQDRPDISRLALWDVPEGPSEQRAAFGEGHLPERIVHGLIDLAGRTEGPSLPSLRLRTELEEEDALGDVDRTAVADDGSLRWLPGPAPWQENHGLGGGGLPMLALKEITEWVIRVG